MASGAWGLYVHIPYCRSICPYCDFNAYAPRNPPWDALQAALLRELRWHAAHTYVGMGPLQSIYFGGGTPSLAPPGLIAAVIDAAQATWGMVPGGEISLEADPSAVAPGLFESLHAAGVRRISLGWQSTHDPLLRRLGRGHSAAQSAAAWHMARAAGFAQVSLDLIFAVPGQTRAQCAQDVARIVALGPEHVSLYALSYHPGTPMTRRRDRGQLQPADELLELQMMQDIEAGLQAAGYDHYEVSNYARPGQQAVHNSLYWQGGQYLGIGPGAHSFRRNGWRSGQRWENVRKPQAYITAWAPQHATLSSPATAWHENLSSTQLFTERMLCALRQPRGIHLDEPACLHHAAQAAAGIKHALHSGWATLEGRWLRPTPTGLRHADALAALFF